MQLGRGIVGALLGALPGFVLILIAEYAIEGEVQLTVGVGGIWLAVAGALVGLILGLRGQRRRPSDH